MLDVCSALTIFWPVGVVEDLDAVLFIISHTFHCDGANDKVRVRTVDLLSNVAHYQRICDREMTKFELKLITW